MELDAVIVKQLIGDLCLENYALRMNLEEALKKLQELVRKAGEQE